jgi:hypothetical protein
MQGLIDFFNHPFFVMVGGLTTVIAILGSIYTLFLITKGILPVWYRLGLGLSKRRIAILADSGFDELKSLLIDSEIFNQKNISKIGHGELKKIQQQTLLLIYWKEYSHQIDEIINLSADSTALIIYAPPQDGRIDDDSMKKINSQRNAVVVNFRGRLLNDILTTMITSGLRM